MYKVELHQSGSLTMQTLSEQVVGISELEALAFDQHFGREQAGRWPGTLVERPPRAEPGHLQVLTFHPA